MRKLLLIVILTGVSLFAVPLANAARFHSSVSGAVFTTVDHAVDGVGHAKNTPNNTNIYFGKKYVWLNGGPQANGLTAGVYFFAVLTPGGQGGDQNDNGAKNLSCRPDGSPAAACADPYTNRTFTVGANGEIASYAGTHDQDPNGGNGILIRLCKGGGCPPYYDTPNNGGEYDLAVCYLGPDAAHLTYPAANKSCKHDAFKVQSETTPPTCKLTATILGPPKSIQVTVQDTGSGIASITTVASNAIVTQTPPLVLNTTDPVLITATKQVQTLGSKLKVTVADGAGNTTVCDPLIPAERIVRLHGSAHRAIFGGLSAAADLIQIRNGAHTTSAFAIRVNGHTLALRPLKAHEVRRLVIPRRLFVPGMHNRVTVSRATGAGSSVVIIG